MQETSFILDRLVVVKIDATLWGGRKKLRKEDLILADGSVLPPEDLASLGSKKIADPRELAVFHRLKKEAERICLKVGTRFLGGFVVPQGTIESIQRDLITGYPRRFPCLTSGSARRADASPGRALLLPRP